MKNIKLSRDVRPSQGLQPHLPIKPLCVPIQLSDGFSGEVSSRFNNRVYSLWERLGLVFLEEEDSPVQTVENRVVINNFTQQIIFQLFSRKNIGRLIDLDQPGFILLGKAFAAAKSSDEFKKKRIAEQLERRRVQKTEYSAELQRVLKLLTGEETSVTDETLMRVLKSVIENITYEDLTNEQNTAVIKNLRSQLEKRENFIGLTLGLSRLVLNSDKENIKNTTEYILTRIKEIESDIGSDIVQSLSDNTIRYINNIRDHTLNNNVIRDHIVSADVRAVKLAFSGSREIDEKQAEELFSKDFPIAKRQRPSEFYALNNITAAEQSATITTERQINTLGTVLSRREQFYSDAVYFLENAEENGAERFSEIFDILKQSSISVGRSQSALPARNFENANRSMTASLMNRISRYIADKLAQDNGNILEEYRVLAHAERFSDILASGALGRVRNNSVYFEPSYLETPGSALEESVRPRGVARYDPDERAKSGRSQRGDVESDIGLPEYLDNTADNNVTLSSLNGDINNVKTGSAALVNSDYQIGSPISGELSYTETSTGSDAVTEAAKQGSIAPVSADFRTSYSTSGELSYTETSTGSDAVTEAAKQGSVAPVSADFRTSSSTSGKLSYTETPTGADAVMESAKQGSVASVSANSQTVSSTNGELSYTETATGVDAVTEAAKQGSVAPVSAVSQTSSSTSGKLSYTEPPTGADATTEAAKQGSVAPVSADFRTAPSISGELSYTETSTGADTVTEAAKQGSVTPVSVDSRTAPSTSGKLSYTETPASADAVTEAAKQGSVAPVSAGSRTGSSTSGKLSYTETPTGADVTTEAAKQGSVAPVSASSRTGSSTSGKLSYTETPTSADVTTESAKQGSVDPVSASTRTSSSTSGKLSYTETPTGADAVTEAAKQGSVVPVSAVSQTSSHTSGELSYIETPTGADAVTGATKTGSVTTVSADHQIGSSTSKELSYTEAPTSTDTAEETAKQGSVVPVSAVPQTSSHTSGELSYIETPTGADAVTEAAKQGLVVPVSAVSRTSSSTSGELSYSEIPHSLDSQINSTIRAIGRALPFKRAARPKNSQNLHARNTERGVVLPERSTAIAIAVRTADIQHTTSSDNGEIFRESKKNVASYRDKLDSKTLEALDRIISQARGESPSLSSAGTMVRSYRGTVAQEFDDADMSFYSEPELPSGSLMVTIGGIPQRSVGHAEMRILHRSLKNAAKLKSSIVPEKPKSPHLARIIKALEDENTIEVKKQGIAAKSGFSFRTMDDGEEMVMLIPPTPMDSAFAENGYVRQLPPIDHKQRGEEQTPQSPVPSKPKVINTSRSSVQIVKNEAAGRFENMTREEINKLTDIVYEQLQTRIMRERRRFGL